MTEKIPTNPTVNQLAKQYYFKFLTKLNSHSNPLIKHLSRQRSPPSHFLIMYDIRRRLKRRWRNTKNY